MLIVYSFLGGLQIRNNARYLWKRIPPAIKSVSIFQYSVLCECGNIHLNSSLLKVLKFLFSFLCGSQK